MSFLIGTLSFVMVAISLFMILLVLIQRGRGGGLAGAFGGMGGQSAFGTRAGDMFTRITIVLAVVWVLLAGGLGMMMRRDAEAAKTGKDKGGFEQGAESNKKQDDAGNTPESSLKSDDAAKTKSEVPSKSEDAVPSGAKTPAESDVPALDAEKVDTNEVEKSTPGGGSDGPKEAELGKELPAEAPAPGLETLSTEPNP